MRRSLAAVPAWAWLAAIVILSIALRYALGRRMVAPWIMVDELIYSELAKSFAEQREFLIRDEPTAAYGAVYPILISPAWALWEAVPAAYEAAKAINAVVMSLAAVPAYLLARRFLSARFALVAAALTVAVPSMLYTGTLMTENVFYPLFLLVALALVLVLERPSAPRVALLLGMVVVGFLTRAQAVALLPAIAVAPFLLRGVRAPRAYAALYVPLVAGALALFVVQRVRGRALLDVLGAYETVGESRHYEFGAVAKWLLWHVAELDLYVGVLPFAALLLLTLRWRPEDRLFLAATLPLVVFLVGSVSAFASLSSVQRIEERNMFYVAPLFFVALLLWIERGLPRGPLALGCAAVAGVLPVVIPYPRLIGVSAQSDTLMLLPWWWLQDQVLDLSWVRWEVLLVTAASAICFWAIPSRYALVLPAFLFAYYAVTALPIENGRHGMRQASVGALFQGITSGDRNWIDEVADGREAAIVWSGAPVDHQVVWQNEFFNRSVGRVYHLDEPVPGGLAQDGVRVGDDGELVGAERVEYVDADDAVMAAGAVVARDELKGVTVHRVAGQPAVAALLGGVYEDGWSKPFFSYHRFRDCRGTATLTIESDASLFRRPQRVRVVAAGAPEVVVLRPGQRRELTAPLSPEHCFAVVAVTPTAVPARARAGSTDTRRLGVLVRDVEFRP